MVLRGAPGTGLGHAMRRLQDLVEPAETTVVRRGLSGHTWEHPPSHARSPRVVWFDGRDGGAVPTPDIVGPWLSGDAPPTLVVVVGFPLAPGAADPAAELHRLPAHVTHSSLLPLDDRSLHDLVLRWRPDGSAGDVVDRSAGLPGLARTMTQQTDTDAPLTLARQIVSLLGPEAGRLLAHVARNPSFLLEPFLREHGFAAAYATDHAESLHLITHNDTKPGLMRWTAPIFSMAVRQVWSNDDH